MSKRGRDERGGPSGRRDDGCGPPGSRFTDPGDDGTPPGPFSRPDADGVHRWRRVRRAHGGWAGGAVIATTAVQMVGTNILAKHARLFRPWDNLATVVLLIGPVALFWRRRAPVTVFLIASAAS